MPPGSKEPGRTPNAGTNPGRRGDSWFSRIIRAGIALADGKPTDWSAIERLPCRPRQKAQLRELQEIEKIAQHYRGAQAEDGAQLIDLGEHFRSSLPDTMVAIRVAA